MHLPPALRAARRPWRTFLRTAIDLLLPEVCPACGAPASGLCAPCDQNLVRRPAAACVRCGEAVLVGVDSCGGEHRELRGLAHHVAPWRFAGTGGALVRRFKLDGNAGAGRWLGRAMADAWRRQVGRAWRRAVVVPVPLHAARRRRRGFDQAAWLAHEVGRRLDLEVAVAALRRTRATLPQGDPRVLSRATNVEGAFAPRWIGAVVERDVVLIDDVLTSGATLRQCATVLRSVGAKRVAALTACRS
jgi:competence protein ComFC